MFTSVKLFAGPICSGFWDCLPLTITFYAIQVLPISLGLFIVSLLVFQVLKKHRPNLRWIALLLACSLLAGHFGYAAFTNWRFNDKYQATESREAQAISFTLYQPEYVVPGFELVENEINPWDELVFTYYDRSTQQSESSVATNLYSVVVHTATLQPRSLLHTDGEESVLAFETRDNTTVAVSGTISKEEADKVLASIKEVKPSNIKFYSDWASTR